MSEKEQSSGLSTIAHTGDAHTKDWKPLDQKIREYCDDYSVKKTKDDFIKGILIVCGLFGVTLITTVIGKKFGMFQYCAVGLAVIIAFIIYKMNLDFQKVFQRTLRSSDCEYAIVTLKDVTVVETKEAGNFFSKKPGCYTSVTVGFSDTDETFPCTLERCNIGDLVLLVKKKSVSKIGSKFCFKIPYAK